MERIDILKNLESIYRDILNDDSIILSEDTTADDIEDWDSLTHVQIVAEIQDVFNIKFSAKEILLWENVGDIIDAIEG